MTNNRIQRLLGNLMLEPTHAAAVFLTLPTSDALRVLGKDYGLVYLAIADCYRRGACDSVLVKEELIRRGWLDAIGGIEGLVGILEAAERDNPVAIAESLL